MLLSVNMLWFVYVLYAVEVCSVYPYGRNILRAFAVQILRIDIEVAILSVNDLIALVEQELEF